MGKGERVEIFQRSVLKNTTRPLTITKRGTRARPLAEVAEGGFLVSPFSEKKVKVFKVLIFQVVIFPLDLAIVRMVLASQSTHFTNVKYSVLYFTWK